MTPPAPRSGNPAIPQRNRGALLIWTEKNTQWRAPQPDRNAHHRLLASKWQRRPPRNSGLFPLLRPFPQGQADVRVGKRYENPHHIPPKGEVDAPDDLYKQGWRTAKWRDDVDTERLAEIGSAA